METYKAFPTLYCRRKNLCKWRVWVSVDKSDNTARYDTEWGIVDGKMQTGYKVFLKGNTRSTALEVAMTRANRLWENKKRVRGYSEDIPLIGTQEKRVSPMLAHEYNKQKKKIVFPCFVQPKLDGVRALIIRTNDGVEIRSRTGNIYTMPIIMDKFRTIVEAMSPRSFLDGELYTHGMEFDKISGICRRIDDHPDKALLEFHCFDYYDAADPTMPFKARLERIRSLLDGEVVDTRMVGTHDDIVKAHDTYVTCGYEGVMVRNTMSVYRLDYRSYGLLKLKIFDDSEFKCTGFVEGTGKFRKTPIIICETPDGTAFRVAPDGTFAKKRALFTKMRDKGYGVGVLYTVRHQGVSEAGVPRFPVGVAFRDYE